MLANLFLSNFSPLPAFTTHTATHTLPVLVFDTDEG